jgi:hypothetical protein
VEEARRLCKNLAPDQDDLYGQDQLGLRGSLRFTPTSDFTADLVFTYDRQRNTGTPFLSKNLGSTAVDRLYGAAYLGGSPYSAEVLGSDKLGLNRDVYDVNLTASWDFADGWNFTTVNGYRKFDSHEVFDADGSAAWFLEFAEDAKGWQASHEGRFTYSDDQWRASFGWNYFIEDNTQKVPFSTEVGTFLQCYASLIPALGCVNSSNVSTASAATSLLTGGAYTAVPYSSWYANRGRNQSWSMFGDVTFKPVPALELTAGARILIEKRRSGYATYQPAARSMAPNCCRSSIPTARGPMPSAPTPRCCRASMRSTTSIRISTFTPRSPKAAARRWWNWQRDDQRRLRGQPQPCSPGNGVELRSGVKGRAGIFSGSLGVYYDDYSNFQVSVAASGTVTQSAGSAGNIGVEGELEAKFTNWLSAFANAGYISGGIDDKASNGVFAGDQFRLSPSGSGRRASISTCRSPKTPACS